MYVSVCVEWEVIGEIVFCVCCSLSLSFCLTTSVCPLGFNLMGICCQKSDYSLSPNLIWAFILLRGSIESRVYGRPFTILYYKYLYTCAPSLYCKLLKDKDYSVFSCLGWYLMHGFHCMLVL